MTSDKLPPGIAFICTSQGIIQKVLLDGIGVIGLAEGQNLEVIIDSANRLKLVNFLAELRAKGAAIDWEFDVFNGNRFETIQLSGINHQDHLMIMGSHDSKEALLICNEFIKIDNEQAILLRTALIKHLRISQSGNSESGSLYDEMNWLNNELLALQRELAKKNNELEKLNQTVQVLSVTDPLTKINNRRGFFEKAERQISQAKRYRHPLSLVMADIDKFKSVNDNYGHIVGDQVLAELASRISKMLRAVDIFARYGGDEFVILLPETTASNTFFIAERIRVAVLEPFLLGGRSLFVPLSMGVVELNEKTNDLEGLLKWADRAMFKAKSRGGNFICFEDQH